jgi:hypothetical protein
MYSTIKNVLKNIFLTFLFVFSSAIIWMLVNDFYIARPEGFDPFRYEYYARTGLPDYLDGSSSFTIVLILQFIYKFLPFYFGYVFFIGFLFFTVLNSIEKVEVKFALYSPIAFFYISQTGKDGLAILAMACIAIVALQRFRLNYIMLLMVISIALIVRPALILFLTTTFVFFRFGFRKALFISILISFIFLIFDIGSESISALEDLASDESSGKIAQYFRELTYGYSISSITTRSILLFISPFIQPIGSVVKLINGVDFFVLFEGFCQLLFLICIIRSKILKRFFINSLPFVVVIASASPFYHFRYMAITYPVIFLLSLIERNKI